jgi:hypothetical protein
VEGYRWSNTDSYHCSTLTGSIQGIVFSIGNRCILLANLSKDNTRIELVEVEMDSMVFRSMDS